MKKTKLKTIEKVTNHLHDIFDASGRALENKNMIERFSIDLVKDTRAHLELLDKIIAKVEVDEHGVIKESIKGYIELKTDTLDEIIALELLVYDKKRTYQELLVKSNREYANLKDGLESPELRNALKKDLADEIYNFKEYLNELVSIADTKRVMLSDRLVEAQNRNRQLVDMLERESKRNVFTDIITGRFAIAH